jgi:hypothetical protein
MIVTAGFLNEFSLVLLEKHSTLRFPLGGTGTAG